LRSYIRVDPELPDRKEKYPDGAATAFFFTLCFAEHQPRRGRFRNKRVLSALLGRRARWIPYLIEHHDLILNDKGELYFDGWDEWQEGDWKVQERVERIRARKAGTVTGTVTPAVNTTVNTPSEPLAVGGRRLAVSALRVERNQDPNDPVLQLQIWWHEFIGRQISEHDKQAAEAFVFDYQRLGLDGIKARIIQHAAWRVENKKPTLGKLEFYRDTLREQETFLADQDIPRPRDSGVSTGMRRLSEVLAS
jgi:hypothetical protein